MLLVWFWLFCIFWVPILGGVTEEFLIVFFMYVVGDDMVDAFMSSRTDEVLYLFLGCILWMLRKKRRVWGRSWEAMSETELLCPKNPCTSVKGRTERLNSNYLNHQGSNANWKRACLALPIGNQ